MPRKGHKEGCQCFICQRLAAAPKTEPAVAPALLAVPAGMIRFRDLRPGDTFEVEVIAMERQDGRYLYRKVSGSNAVNLSTQGVDQSPEVFSGDTLVLERKPVQRNDGM